MSGKVYAAAICALALNAPVGSASLDAKPRVVTQAQSGSTIVLQRGSIALLRLGHRRWDWAAPRLRGSAVTLEQIEYERDPGFDEWKIRAVSSGRARVTVHGDACDGCAARDRLFLLTVLVR